MTTAITSPSLVYEKDGLALVGAGLHLRVDFASMLSRIQQQKLHQELLLKASRIKTNQGHSPYAIDATAGLGEDAFLLAAAGFEVDLYEQNPSIAALLRDGLARALNDERLAQTAKRMTLHEADSVSAMRALPRSPDVIYLDPMFPEKTKNAATKKKFQLLHFLEAPCTNEEGLLKAALRATPQKVIVKRPAKGPDLAGIKPAYRISGKAVRYDIYTPISMNLLDL